MLKGLVSLITGGSSGLGKATVERLLIQGGSVLICDLPGSNGQKLAEELGSNADFLPVDVTSETNVQEAVATVKKIFGKLDVVVNCAGIFYPGLTYNPRKQKPYFLERFEHMMKVNLTGTFNVIRLAAGLMVENEPNADGQRGVIINAASIASFGASAGSAAYSASKAAVAGITLPLARDFSTVGIRVVAIAPCFFQTPMVEQQLAYHPGHEYTGFNFPKRVGNPPEFAILVQSIIENPYLNGELIRLDGGSRMENL